MLSAAKHLGHTKGPRRPGILPCAQDDTRPSRRRYGFTLFELVLVMVIITTALAVITPSLRGFSHGARMRDTSTQLVALCQWARTQAISTGRVHRLHIDPTNAQYRVLIQEADQFVAPPSNLGNAFVMPQGYRIALTKADGSGTDYVDFFPTGRTEAARILITADDGEQSLIECPTPSETFKVVTQTEVAR